MCSRLPGAYPPSQGAVTVASYAQRPSELDGRESEEDSQSEHAQWSASAICGAPSPRPSEAGRRGHGRASDRETTPRGVERGLAVITARADFYPAGASGATQRRSLPSMLGEKPALCPRRAELGAAARRAAETRWSWAGVARRLLEPLQLL